MQTVHQTKQSSNRADPKIIKSSRGGNRRYLIGRYVVPRKCDRREYFRMYSFVDVDVLFNVLGQVTARLSLLKMPICAMTSAILMMIILSALGIVPQGTHAASQSTFGGPCQSAANALYSNVNLDVAVQVAQASQAFKVESARFQNVAYYSTLETDKWTGGSACVPEYQFFNVVFQRPIRQVPGLTL